MQIFAGLMQCCCLILPCCRILDEHHRIGLSYLVYVFAACEEVDERTERKFAELWERSGRSL